MSANINAIKDRVLVLQDKVDAVSKAFNPDEPRDKDGKWSTGGATNMSRRGFLGGALSVAVAAQVPAKALATFDVPSAVGQYNVFSGGLNIAPPAGLSLADAASAVKARLGAIDLDRHSWPDFQHAIMGEDNVPYLWDSASESFTRASQERLAELSSKVRYWKPPSKTAAVRATRALKEIAQQAENDARRKQLVEERIARERPQRGGRSRAAIYAGSVGDTATALDLTKRVRDLQIQVGALEKAFDPNEARDAKGRWSSSGAGKAVKGAAAWLSQSKVAQAAKSGDLGERAKDILAATVAAVITSHNNNDDATEAVKQSILHASVGMKVTANEAREHVSRTLNRLRAMRTREKPDVAKAEDPIRALLTKIINELDALDLEDK